MAEDRNFTLKIITPERIFYEGPVSMVEFNTTDEIVARPQDKRTEDYITGRFG